MYILEYLVLAEEINSMHIKKLITIYNCKKAVTEVAAIVL